MSYQNATSDRAGLLAGLRTQPGPAAPPNTGYNRMQMQAEQLQMAQMQASQAQYLAQQRDLWELHQTQMSLQLQAMKLQNLEIQERILAASTQQPTVPQHNRRPVSASYADVNSIGLPVEADDESRQQRRGALNNLQRAQMHRSAEPVQFTATTGARRYPGSRLSFNADALADHALARKNAASPVSSESNKRASSVSPPAVEQQTNPFPRHHRKTSSLGSFASDHSGTLSENKKLLTSPSGPTLVLSQPGEQYPASPSSIGAGRPIPSRPLVVDISHSPEKHVKEDSSGSSSPGSESGSSSASEVLSFESVTSVGSELANPKQRTAALTTNGGMVKSSSDGKLVRHTASVNKLNAAAPTFMPTRNFSTPASMMAPVVMPGAVAIRQPRGPAREGEMEAKNFAGRIRKRAFKATALKLKGRAGGSSAPPSPVTLQDPTFQF